MGRASSASATSASIAGEPPYSVVIRSSSIAAATAAASKRRPITSVPPLTHTGNVKLWSAMWKMSGRNAQSRMSLSSATPRVWVSANE